MIILYFFVAVAAASSDPLHATIAIVVGLFAPTMRQLLVREGVVGIVLAIGTVMMAHSQQLDTMLILPPAIVASAMLVGSIVFSLKILVRKFYS